MTNLARGTIAIPEPATHRPATPLADLDQAVSELLARAEPWSRAPVDELVGLVDACLTATLAVAPDWVAAGTAAKRLRADTSEAAEEWVYSIFNTTRFLRLLLRSLRGIAATGRPVIPGRVRTGPGGRVVVPALPVDAYDRVLFPRFSAEVWLAPGVSAEELTAGQADTYREPVDPGVSLVLGAGNVAAIPVLDALDRLFRARHPVVLKMNPVNDYAGPFIEKALLPLVDRGVLRVVYGGVEVGAHLVAHPDVADVHITGSDKSFEAIVFGPGPEGAARKAARQVLVDKPVSGELGNVTPLIVVPGPWSDRDHAYQGANVAAMLTCIALRVLVTQRSWPGRAALLTQIRRALRETPERYPYYPGAEERWARFVEAHPEADRFGAEGPGAVPWTWIQGLDPAAGEELCFTTESFTGVCSEATLPEESPADFVRAAVRFCNDGLWGTLGAGLLVHPASLRDAAVRAAVEDAVTDLRYGTVAVNLWPGFNFALGSTTWGAYPGHTLDDIGSGIGVVHNALMLPDVEKTVLRAPFRLPLPTPPWFPNHRRAESLWRNWAYLEGRRSPARLAGVLANLVRG
ncbi:MAG: aldehyde dehydrogenase family protein [Mycobacteriales bacterium]